MALVTAAEVKDVITGLSGASDTLLTNTLIPRAGSMIAQFCGYPPATAAASPTLESTAYTRYTGDPGVWVDPEDSRTLHLEPWPVTAISAVYDDSLEAFGSGTEVTASQYNQRGARGHLLRLTQSATIGVWSTTDGFVKVTFTAGYSTVPDDIKAAACELVAHLYELNHRRGKSSISDENRVTAYRTETIPDHVREMLAPYVLPSVLV